MTPVIERETTGAETRITTGGETRILARGYEPYEGYNLFDVPVNWAEEPTEGLARSMTVLENRTGLHTVRSHTDTPIGYLKVNVTLVGRDAIHEFRSWEREMKGGQIPVWVPTWQSDLKPTQDFSGTSMVVESIGYDDNMFPHNARKHLAIMEPGGTIYPRGVSNAVDNGTTETLTLNESMGTTIYANACLVSFLLFARLAKETVKWRWNSRDLVEVDLTFAELPRETPAP
jgi:hypothetical protein